MNKDREDQLVGELMGKSANAMPFADFEERLMNRIQREGERSRSFWRNLKLSWLFFAIGTLFGLFLSVLLERMDWTVFGWPTHRVILVAQLFFSVVILTQFDKLLELTKKKGRQKQEIV